MGNFIDLTGQHFGKLTVLNRATSNSKSGNVMWVCRCDCENVVTVIGSHLLNHHTTSCGCNRIGKASNGHSRERLYRIWYRMRRRCLVQSDEHFKWYGGRGISICSEWDDYEVFRTWAMNNGYSDNLTIDRKEVNGNYCPDNCRWADIKTQANNRSSNRFLELNGKTYTVTQMAEAFGITPDTIFNRLKLGWSPERIVGTPERSAKKHGTA